MARNSYIKPASIILAIIVLAAAVIRLVGLDSYPASLYWEEAALGYDAYSILKTGKDYHGNPFPLVSFVSFGDYKPSLYFYATAGSIALFGLSDYAVRFPSALAGILAVVIVYGIARKLKLSESIALTAAGLLALMPWHIQFSRAAFEVNFGLTLYLAGFYFFLTARKKPAFLLTSAIFFVLSMYTYHGFRVIAPLTGLALYAYYRKDFLIKRIFVTGVIAFILAFPILTNIKDPSVNQRFAETSFFPESKAVDITNQLRLGSGNTLLSRVVYHRYWWWAKELTQNYLNNFHPNFLFIEGDRNPRHQTGEFGLLFHWQIAAVLIGIYFIVTKKTKNLMPVILMLLLTPIPAMLTKTNPHSLRMLPAAPGYALLMAYGLVSFYESLKFKKTFVSLVSAIAVCELVAFGHFYFTHYSALSSKEWQYGYKQAVQYTESVKDQYQAIYFTRELGRPSIYVLYYGGYDPAEIQAKDKMYKKDQQELLEFGKYQFFDPISPTSKSLIVAAPNHPIPLTAHVLKTINYPDGQPAFIIYE